jgi:hypothetical protein
MITRRIGISASVKVTMRRKTPEELLASDPDADRMIPRSAIAAVKMRKKIRLLLTAFFSLI